ncbi:MAG: adenine nucleotide alpha hydrolase family protein [Armatimonadetes bacterium]|nr:adenine nucleotide alpha hydrolase family protein [Armatimonadota bacterium]
MRCLKCRGVAAVEVRRHRAAYCAPHFLEFFEAQVHRALTTQRMLRPEERILVAVSGGKDSLALWEVLLRRGDDTTGLHINLGIGDYSRESRARTEEFARARGARLFVADLREEYGMDIGTLAEASGRSPCSACGLSKRYLFNKMARDGGFTAVATGHNLDDEAAVLLGNLLHWNMDQLARQAPVLEQTHPHLVRRVKPLYRTSERESAAYAILRGIDYVIEECPHSRGARSLLHKGVLNSLEAASAGTKQAFYWGFLDRLAPVIRAGGPPALHPCRQCDQPTTEEVCAFCRMTARAAARLNARTPSLP